MKKILIILISICSIVSFSAEIVNEVVNDNSVPIIENVSISDVANEEFIISVMGSLESDPEIMNKINEIGEIVDSEVQKDSPDWKKVEELYNELSIYTNKVAVNMMRTLKEGGLEKSDPNFESDMNNEIVSDMFLDQDMPSNPVDENEIMEAIKKGMTTKEIARMEEISGKISTEIELPNPNWEQVEKDYNELSKYTNKVTVIIMQVEKKRNGVQ
ncbi:MULTISPECIES: hypothetical protein [unclassified Cetobacterium]|uniref:hypothetical protein n=1 Tax=unclassified Cetobacterium TaxID=2630983 RepID=UPI000648092A|nr:MULTISPECIES: hypothetical protein [unclassified Cetobacterium]